MSTRVRFAKLILMLLLMSSAACSHTSENGNNDAQDRLSLTPSTLSMTVGDEATVAVSGAKGDRFTVESADPSVATAVILAEAISVRAVGQGTTRIVVSVSRKGSATLTVSVVAAPEGELPDQSLSDRSERFVKGPITMRYDDGGLLLQRYGNGTIEGRDLVGGHVFLFNPGTKQTAKGTMLPDASLSFDGTAIPVVGAMVAGHDETTVWYTMKEASGSDRIAIVLNIETNI